MSVWGRIARSKALPTKIALKADMAANQGVEQETITRQTAGKTSRVKHFCKKKTERKIVQSARSSFKEQWLGADTDTNNNERVLTPITNNERVPAKRELRPHGAFSAHLKRQTPP